MWLSLLLLGFGTYASVVTYTASNAVIANPERGLDHTTTDCGTSAFSANTLRSYRNNEQITLLVCVYYLPPTVNLTSTQLTFFNTQMATLRTAGIKTVLRFAYTENDKNDAALPQIIQHLEQLAPLIQNNSDVIALFQAGFIGRWGEWYYTNNFGDQNNITPQQWADRKAVTDKMLDVLPVSRMISLRTPTFAIRMYGGSPITSATAFNGSAVSRLGQHNDAFLADSTDSGTYQNTATEFPYLRTQSTYTPMGGETNNYAPLFTNCSNALRDMTQFHWDYVNTDYHEDAIAAWQRDGCLDTIKKRIGYRFVLTQAEFPEAVPLNGSLHIRISIINDGFSSPYNPRGLELVLRETSSNEEYVFALASDPRTWLANTTTTIDEFVRLTNVPVNSYALFLSLPDPLLPNRSEYAIQLANVETWETSTGYNDLKANVSVIPGTLSPTTSPTTQSAPTAATSDASALWLPFPLLAACFILLECP